MDTKSCNLTEHEIEKLIMYHGHNLHDNTADRLERMNYLHKRLKAFKEVEPMKADITEPGGITGWPKNG